MAELRVFFRSIISSSHIDIDKLDQLLSKFSDIEGASLQIRGTLFEFKAKMARYEFRSEAVLMNRIYHDLKDSTLRVEADLTIEQGMQALSSWNARALPPTARLMRKSSRNGFRCACPASMRQPDRAEVVKTKNRL